MTIFRRLLLSQRRRFRAPVAAILVAMSLTAVAVRSALAHSRVEVGPYAVVVGWLQEPPIVGERNALVIEISEGESPVEGVEATLDAELLYGRRTFRTNLNPTVTPGLYTAEIFPTVRGQYAVRLFGTIGEVEVDEIVEPEEVFPASRIQFPQAQPDPGELQKEFQADIAELESQLGRAQLLAVAGIVAGLLGTGLAALGLLRQRR